MCEHCRAADEWLKAHGDEFLDKLEPEAQKKVLAALVISLTDTEAAAVTLGLLAIQDEAFYYLKAMQQEDQIIAAKEATNNLFAKLGVKH